MGLIVDSTYKFVVDGITGSASANTTTNLDYKLLQTLAVFGFTMIQSGATFGDYVGIDIIDKDNVLGYGANTVLASPVLKAYVDPNSTLVQFISEYAKTIPSGIYIRIKYTNTSLLTSVSAAANFHFITLT